MTRMDTVSGAEVPEPESEPTAAMEDAGVAVMIAGGYRTRVLVRRVWIAMERMRLAEIRHPYHPPGYRNASEDEPERTAGRKP